jgi:hypothetical protein
MKRNPGKKFTGDIEDVSSKIVDGMAETGSTAFITFL